MVKDSKQYQLQPYYHSEETMGKQTTTPNCLTTFSATTTHMCHVSLQDNFDIGSRVTIPHTWALNERGSLELANTVNNIWVIY